MFWDFVVVHNCFFLVFIIIHDSNINGRGVGSFLCGKPFWEGNQRLNSLLLLSCKEDRDGGSDGRCYRANDLPSFFFRVCHVSMFFMSRQFPVAVSGNNRHLYSTACFLGAKIRMFFFIPQHFLQNIGSFLFGTNSFVLLKVL